MVKVDRIVLRPKAGTTCGGVIGVVERPLRFLVGVVARKGGSGRRHSKFGLGAANLRKEIVRLCCLKNASAKEMESHKSQNHLGGNMV